MTQPDTSVRAFIKAGLSLPRRFVSSCKNDREVRFLTAFILWTIAGAAGVVAIGMWVGLICLAVAGLSMVYEFWRMEKIEEYEAGRKQ